MTAARMMSPPTLRSARISNSVRVLCRARIETAMAEKDRSVPAIQRTTMRKLPCGRAGEAEAD